MENARIALNGLLVPSVAAIVATVVLLVILNMLGVFIAPLLTALGVGGLAVALALKDTLSNLFAALHALHKRYAQEGIAIPAGNAG